MDTIQNWSFNNRRVVVKVSSGSTLEPVVVVLDMDYIEVVLGIVVVAGYIEVLHTGSLVEPQEVVEQMDTDMGMDMVRRLFFPLFLVEVVSVFRGLVQLFAEVFF
jgi:hypothetical protein